MSEKLAIATRGCPFASRIGRQHENHICLEQMLHKLVYIRQNRTTKRSLFEGYFSLKKNFLCYETSSWRSLKRGLTYRTYQNTMCNIAPLTPMALLYFTYAGPAPFMRPTEAVPSGSRLAGTLPSFHLLTSTGPISPPAPHTHRDAQKRKGRWEQNIPFHYGSHFLQSFNQGTIWNWVRPE